MIASDPKLFETCLLRYLQMFQTPPLVWGRGLCLFGCLLWGFSFVGGFGFAAGLLSKNSLKCAV